MVSPNSKTSRGLRILGVALPMHLYRWVSRDAKKKSNKVSRGEHIRRVLQKDYEKSKRK